jgi:WD40 repeat protein
LDPQNRYLGVGCRDKSFTLFDTSTYVAVKTFHTASWVTSVSWGPAQLNSSDVSQQKDVVAIRSDNTCISILDLTPTGLTDVQLSSQKGEASSISWSYDATIVARSLGSQIVVSDPLEGFRDIWSYEMKGEVTSVVFSQIDGQPNNLAAVDDCGNLVIHQLQFQGSGDLQAIHTNSTLVDSNLKALAYSPDGTVIATGGRSKLLYLFNSSDLQPQFEPIKLNARVWDIEYVPKQVAAVTGTRLSLAVALGDYTAVIFNDKMEQVLQIQRTRTCRCLSFNPVRPTLAIGDGAGSVTVVDYVEEEITNEFDVNGRVNVLSHSLAGDYLVVGSDDACFSIHETNSFKALQETRSDGFALCASFSPTGMFLALGSGNENYKILRLGPFLAINLIPLALDGGIEQMPPWALKEALFRSWDGPSFVQRHMITGESDNLRRVASILRSYPNAIHTFNRRTGEGSFTTAVQQKIPNLLKLAMVTLVDGTLAPKSDNDKNFIATDIPYQGREILAEIVKNYPPEFAVDVFKAISFMKVPFTCPKVVRNGARLERGSSSYTDPWSDECEGAGYLKKPASKINLGRQSREFITRTPAVLSLPGLGDMDFLASMLMYAPLEVFENEAMAVVVRVVWYNHIRKFFLLDCILYAAYYVSWITLVELTLLSKDNDWRVEWFTLKLIAMTTATFNTVFAVKEIMQVSLGSRELYLKSWWNVVDVTSITCVYVHTLGVMIYGNVQANQVPLAVVTTLLLTSRVLAYLRGFADTGWLISVLVANFRDVRGYLFILMVILVGFSVSFRILFRDNSDAFDSLRRSFLSTFQMTLTSQYDSEIIFQAEHHILAAFIFVLAITGVLVIALNALISILADSYARVQQNAVANRRREVAALIVEYMSLLSPKKRSDIERRTKWFHTLLEVDADGSLQVQADDWEGGLNALRHDMHTIADSTKDDTQKAILEMKNELDNELTKLKKDVLTILEGIRDDIKVVRRAQGIKLPDGRRVVKAVQVVQAVGQKVGEHGGAFLKIAEGQAVKSMGQYRAKSISNFTRT